MSKLVVKGEDIVKKTLTPEEEEAEKAKHEQFNKEKAKPKKEMKDVSDKEIDDVLKSLGARAKKVAEWAKKRLEK